jgi:hypothetical protein
MRMVLSALAFVLLASCSVRVGGGGPTEYTTVAIQFEPGMSVADAATQLRGLRTDVALIATRADTAWVRELATQLQLVSTRPGKAGDFTLAFLAFKPVGDTTLTLNVEGGGAVRLHDALYNVDKVRRLDLMTAIFQPGTSARHGVLALLNYIATDVGGTAAVALAVQAPNPAVADSIAELTRAAMGDVWECTADSKGSQNAPAMALRLFYFPTARMRCATARVVDTANRPVVARLIVS